MRISYQQIKFLLGVFALFAIMALNPWKAALAADPGLQYTTLKTNPPASKPISAVVRERAELNRFILSVRNPKQGDYPVGIYSPGVLANPIVQQPSGKSGFVSRLPEAVTQFRLASAQGSLGLLAHNYLSGKKFFNLEPGHKIYIIYGDGRSEEYQVYALSDYHAINLRLYEDLRTGGRFSDYGVFYRIYSGAGDKLVLQTCIEKDGNSSWGRRFVLAQKVDPTGLPELRLNTGRAAFFPAAIQR